MVLIFFFTFLMMFNCYVAFLLHSNEWEGREISGVNLVKQMGNMCIICKGQGGMCNIFSTSEGTCVTFLKYQGIHMLPARCEHKREGE